MDCLAPRPSLQRGVAGLSPVAANCYPELFAWLCAHHSDEPVKAERLQHRLAGRGGKTEVSTECQATSSSARSADRQSVSRRRA